MLNNAIWVSGGIMIMARLAVGEALYTDVILVTNSVRAADAYLERVSNQPRAIRSAKFTYRRCNIR